VSTTDAISVLRTCIESAIPHGDARRDQALAALMELQGRQASLRQQVNDMSQPFAWLEGRRAELALRLVASPEQVYAALVQVRQQYPELWPEGALERA
jgi:hypothetical protein